MKLSTLSLVIFTSLVTLPASAQQSAKLAPTKAQLVQLPAPEATIEKQAVHFSRPLTAHQLTAGDIGYRSVSDEYWLEIDGRTLNKGVELSINQPEAIIRLSAKQTGVNTLPADHAIDPQTLELRKDSKLVEKAFTQRVTQEQLATASILANSSAVRVSPSAGTGHFQLRVGQELAPEQQYIVNVKEKGSAIEQQLSTSQQAYLTGQQASFNATVFSKQTELADAVHTAFIKAPSGDLTPVSIEKRDDGFSFKLPQSLPENSRGQLVELHVQSKAVMDNREVLRHGKIGFAVAQPTANMTIDSATLNAAKVDLNVGSEGRYAVSGIVYGKDQSNKYVSMMESSSAYYLTPGKQSIELRFDKGILDKSNLVQPFVLRDVKLMDQSRVAVVQRQSAQQQTVLATPKVEQQVSSGSVSLLSLMGLMGLIGVSRASRMRRD
ncbi:DUF4785 family protein [Psychrobium sp. MM17-31]|uniref:DUF4785 domain-containing protein n=1 Tax=Psychrobium sp. MM17-31 TaxID=2917758 RepID=UPI001EF45CD1|nr:DUF4785 domain-containing protein [Psychrobium sp. MM17-31]MCG7530281.1 DUF4785 family protein [Psychrobium sp. MM17-31]